LVTGTKRSTLVTKL
ncbi:hypothetical protein Zm00014a_011405, partial [Zea mays]